MKRSEMIKEMIEIYCGSPTPQSSDTHEIKMNRLLDGLEKLGMLPPLNEESDNIFYENYVYLSSEVDQYCKWEDEDES